MKRLFKIICLAIILSSSFVFVGCGDKEDDYVPQLTKTFSGGGFEVKTTSDFSLVSDVNGLILKSSGDGEISNNETYIYLGYDAGNIGYKFSEVSLEKYTRDIAKIEDVALVNSSTIKMREKFSQNSMVDVDLNMFVLDRQQNVNGNWDFYSIYCLGKAEKSFINIKIETAIADEYYDENITKFSSIIRSIKFTQPSVSSYTEAAKEYISTTKVYSDDVLKDWGFEFKIPNDYIAYINSAYTAGNHFATSYLLEEHWSSSIRCSNLASFFGNAVLDDSGAKNLLTFSENNLLGFYTKKSESENSATYNIYYLNAENKLQINYIIIAVTYSDQLSQLGFDAYFEEQMISWIKDIKFLSAE